MADQVLSAQATPDFGSLGPSSDLQAGKPIAPKTGNLRPVTAGLIGVLGAFAFIGVKAPATHGAWEQISKALTGQGTRSAATSRFDGTSAQHQAESLLRQAINHDDSAVNGIVQSAD